MWELLVREGTLKGIGVHWLLCEVIRLLRGLMDQHVFRHEAATAKLRDSAFDGHGRIAWLELVSELGLGGKVVELLVTARVVLITRVDVISLRLRRLLRA